MAPASLTTFRGETEASRKSLFSPGPTATEKRCRWSASPFSNVFTHWYIHRCDVDSGVTDHTETEPNIWISRGNGVRISIMCFLTWVRSGNIQVFSKAPLTWNLSNKLVLVKRSAPFRKQVVKTLAQDYFTTVRWRQHRPWHSEAKLGLTRGPNSPGPRRCRQVVPLITSPILQYGDPLALRSPRPSRTWKPPLLL